MISANRHKYLIFDYVNWKGEKARRRIEVDDIYFGSTQFHKEPQWIMKAYDLDKQAFREFAMKDMTNVHHRGECIYCNGWGIVDVFGGGFKDCEICQGIG